MQKKSRFIAPLKMLWSTIHSIFVALTVFRRQKDPVAFASREITRWSDSLLNACEVKFKVIGKENLEPNKAFLFMSNHESLMDIPVIFSGLPHPIRGVSKEELMRIPLFGPAMYAAGYLPIDRKNRPKAIKQLEAVKASLQKGVSIWMAPEGTRSRDGKLAAFKKGGFHLALDLQVEIVPVWIDGAFKVVQPDSLTINLGRTIRLYIGKPLATHGFNKDDIETLMQVVREKMTALKPL